MNFVRKGQSSYFKWGYEITALCTIIYHHGKLTQGSIQPPIQGRSFTSVKEPIWVKNHSTKSLIVKYNHLSYCCIYEQTKYKFILATDCPKNDIYYNNCIYNFYFAQLLSWYQANKTSSAGGQAAMVWRGDDLSSPRLCLHSEFCGDFRVPTQTSRWRFISVIIA